MSWSACLNEFSIPKSQYTIERMPLILAIQTFRISEGLDIEEIEQERNTLLHKMTVNGFLNFST